VVVVPKGQVATCPILVCNYRTLKSTIATAEKLPALDKEGKGWLDNVNYKATLLTIVKLKLPLLFLGEGWGEVKAPALDKEGLGLTVPIKL
jgi:hypothetical protein